MRGGGSNRRGPLVGYRERRDGEGDGVGRVGCSAGGLGCVKGKGRRKRDGSGKKKGKGRGKKKSF